YVDEDTLYISWEPEDIDRHKYEKSLESIKKSVEAKYNVSDTKVNERTIKHKANGKDNVTNKVTEVGVLQYNDEIKDMVPINPKKINKYRTTNNFPLIPRANMNT